MQSIGVMSNRTKVLDSVRRVLADRSFSDVQIDKVLPRLHEQHIREPKLLAEIVDCWNSLMSNAMIPDAFRTMKATKNAAAIATTPLLKTTTLTSFEHILPTARPPTNSLVDKQKIDMTTILAEVEPDLLLFSPKKLLQRHKNIQGLGFIQNAAEHWIVLFNAPRGYYLQDWHELTKKIFYVDQKVLDLLYDKKEQKEMLVHPIVKGAAVTECEFDHIRTRYLFALRTGYRELSHMQPVQTAFTRPTLKDLILRDDDAYLKKFAPYCSLEEFSCFSNLIKNTEIDEDDADVFNQLAELSALNYEKMQHDVNTSSPESSDVGY